MLFALRVARIYACSISLTPSICRMLRRYVRSHFMSPRCSVPRQLDSGQAVTLRRRRRVTHQLARRVTEAAQQLIH